MVAMNRWGTPGIDEVVAALESRPANAAPLGLATLRAEAHHARRAHLDRGQADLAVALGEVRVAGREQRALHGDRQEKRGAFGQVDSSLQTSSGGRGLEGERGHAATSAGHPSAVPTIRA
jgi:hypothetical protein